MDCWRKMRKFDLSLRSSRSSYFATFRHQLTILSKTDALDEEKWLNMLGTFVKDWFRYESHFVHGRDSLVDILKERGLLSESDAVLRGVHRGVRDRGHLGRVPGGVPGGLAAERNVLRHRAHPFRAHGRRGVHDLRRDLLLVP